MDVNNIKLLRNKDLIHERIEYLRLCRERDRHDYDSIEYTILCKQISDFNRRLKLTYSNIDCSLICGVFTPYELKFLEAL
jgi:hypothetical protein